MDNFALMQTLMMIPHFVISIIYLFAGISILFVRQLPIYTRTTISISILFISFLYMFFYFFPSNLFILEHKLYELANVNLMIIIIIKSILHIFERKKYGYR